MATCSGPKSKARRWAKTSDRKFVAGFAASAKLVSGNGVCRLAQPENRLTGFRR